MRGEAFTLDSIVRAERPFQGYREVRLAGRWERVQRAAPAGSFLVHPSTLAVYLLEPESDDGLATWCCPVQTAAPQRQRFDPALRAGGEFPVLRLLSLPPGSRTSSRPD